MANWRSVMANWRSVMAYWRSVMAKMSVMAREECNGHRCNKRADKEYTWKATKAVHFRGFCVSLITHTPHAHHCSGTPHALLAGVVHGFRKPILQMWSDQPLAALVFAASSFNQPSPPPVQVCSRRRRTASRVDVPTRAAGFARDRFRSTTRSCSKPKRIIT